MSITPQTRPRHPAAVAAGVAVAGEGTGVRPTLVSTDAVCKTQCRWKHLSLTACRQSCSSWAMWQHGSTPDKSDGIHSQRQRPLWGLLSFGRACFRARTCTGCQCDAGQATLSASISYSLELHTFSLQDCGIIELSTSSSGLPVHIDDCLPDA